MNLLGWFRKDPVAKGYVPRRAVVVPHAPNVETITNSIDNFSGPDSISTLGLTLKLLAEGETAAEVGSRYPRLPAVGMVRTFPLPAGCQRLYVNVPNWVHLLVRQERYIHRLHAEVPVWVDPSNNRIAQIDRERLLIEMDPLKSQGHEIWDKWGMNGGEPSLQANLETLPTTQIEEEIGLPRVINSNPVGTTDVDSDEFLQPDMTMYPPVEGVDFDLWVDISAALATERIPPSDYDEFAEEMGAPTGRWGLIDSEWTRRRNSDWKLATKFGEAYEEAVR